MTEDFTIEVQATEGLFGAMELRPDKVVAYCSLHHKAMTARQMTVKKCLCKHCWHCVPNEEHPYWEQREQRKAKRKERKARLEAEYLAIIGGGADAL